MKRKPEEFVEQPKPFTPNVTKGMVRQHAYERFRDRLANLPLTIEDWVETEKDLVEHMRAAVEKMPGDLAA